MFEPTGELLQKAIDAANKETRLAPGEHDMSMAQDAWFRRPDKSMPSDLTWWGWIIIGYILAHKDMVK